MNPYIQQNDDLPSLDIENLTTEDFEEGVPFEHLYALADGDPYVYETEQKRVFDRAKEIKFTGASKIYRSFVRSIDQNFITKNRDQLTRFPKQPIALRSGWSCDEHGVKRVSEGQEITACRHPITITRRIHNIDTGMERVELAYRIGGRWRTVVVDKSTILSNQKILKLGDFGVSVSSKNANDLIEYLQDLDSTNYDKIPTTEATARLGWVTDSDFMPYSDRVSFDGDQSVARIFNSVRTEGDELEWTDTVRAMMRQDTSVQVAMSAAALSPLLRLIGAQPCFVHLWSSMSATGKTLIAMAAASFWGDPTTGAYLQSFNATTVALERIAETLNSCPMVMDELQLGQKYRGQSTFNVYHLAQGQGKGRGTKDGGVDRTATWCNTIITTGETPLVSDRDGQGAAARVLEVEIDRIIFNAKEGNRIAGVLRRNFGWGGPQWVEVLKECDREKLVARFNDLLDEVNACGDVQDKQSVIAAGLLLAAEMLDEHIFRDELSVLTLDTLRPFLASRRETSVGQRAYDFLEGWLAQNWAHFQDDHPERYGLIEPGTIFIMRTVFDAVMKEEGFNPRSVLSGFADQGWIERFKDTDATRNSIRKAIGGARPYCVAFKPTREDDPAKKYVEVKKDEIYPYYL